MGRDERGGLLATDLELLSCRVLLLWEYSRRRNCGSAPILFISMQDAQRPSHFEWNQLLLAYVIRAKPVQLVDNFFMNWFDQGKLVLPGRAK